MRQRTLCLVCVCALGLTAGPALADAGGTNPFGGGTDPLYPGSVLNVSAAVTGQLMTITATGTNALTSELAQPQYGLWLFTYDPQLLPISCPQALSTMENIVGVNTQVASQLNYQQFNEGYFGPFSISVPVSVHGTGPLATCAYTSLLLDDAAWASAEVTLSGSNPPSPSKPSVTKRPHVTLSGGRLRCSPGTWTGNPTSYRYRWLVLHKAGVAGRQTSLALTRSLRGHAVECSVTATNEAGSTTATSPTLKIT